MIFWVFGVLLYLLSVPVVGWLVGQYLKNGWH